ncbi:MAG: uroporphyrinogen decarboxylase family protein [Candidatus Bathyarchaeota archaeon]|nr:uroporphyrinogen decarboxylase family protein [Candidatus Bathyarchaeota archaeon]
MGHSRKDRGILRELGEQVAEIGALPVNEQRRELHGRINNLEKAKPTFHIYEIPWHEMDVNDELKLRTEDPFCQGIERDLRRTLYLWRHMQGDMVMEPVIVQPLCIHDTGLGITEKVDIARTDEKSDVYSRHFHIQIKDEEDIEKIKMPEVTFDAERTEEEYQMRCDIFDGVLPVEKRGMPFEKKIYPWRSSERDTSFWFAPWDEIVRWTGIKEVLVDMFLRPDYVHSIIDRMVDAWLHRLDQYERLGLLKAPPVKFWGIGTAQIFAAVSPAMHEEFALRHEARWFERFGYNFYGCCEPLHHKVDILKKNIPRLRKISISAWVDFDEAVENVGDDIVFAWKPNPAVLAASVWEPEAVRKDMEEKLEKAKDCIVDIHLKDISTVRYQPQRLWEWAQIAAEVTEKYAL